MARKHDTISAVGHRTHGPADVDAAAAPSGPRQDPHCRRGFACRPGAADHRGSTDYAGRVSRAVALVTLVTGRRRRGWKRLLYGGALHRILASRHQPVVGSSDAGLCRVAYSTIRGPTASNNM